jgi:hypothetical protein
MITGALTATHLKGETDKNKEKPAAIKPAARMPMPVNFTACETPSLAEE